MLKAALTFFPKGSLASTSSIPSVLRLSWHFKLKFLGELGGRINSTVPMKRLSGVDKSNSSSWYSDSYIMFNVTSFLASG